MGARSTTRELQKRRARVAFLLMRGVTDTDLIAEDLAKQGLLERPADGDRAAYHAAMKLVRIDVREAKDQVDAMFVTWGEYEAAREELIFTAAQVRDMALADRNGDTALRAAVALARAKGFDLTTAEIRKLPEQPGASGISTTEKSFLLALPPDLRLRWLMTIEGRLPPDAENETMRAETN